MPLDLFWRTEHQQSMLVVRLSKRDEESSRTDWVPEPRPSRASSVRTLRPTVRVGPNTPQLVRLVRHPYGLRGVTMARRREDRGVQVRESLPTWSGLHRDSRPARLQRLSPFRFGWQTSERMRSRVTAEAWLELVDAV